MSDTVTTAVDQAAAIRVFLVDDQELIRTGFALILSTEPDIEIVGEAADGTEALERLDALAADALPAVVLMDVRMPRMNGIEATAEIIRRHPGIRVLVLTTFDLDEYAIDAIAAGASGFLLKDARAAELIRAVRSVADGDAVLAPSVTQRLLARMRAEGEEPAASEPVLPQAAPSSTAGGWGPSKPGRETNVEATLSLLTERELEVFAAVADGLTNAEIGERLFLSESTVKTHVGRVFAKLGLRDRVQAVIRAYELGLRAAG